MAQFLLESMVGTGGPWFQIPQTFRKDKLLFPAWFWTRRIAFSQPNCSNSGSNQKKNAPFPFYWLVYIYPSIVVDENPP